MEEVLQEPPLPTGSEDIECGVLDMSGDGVVDRKDLSRLVRQRKTFDLNGDNKLSSIDTKNFASCWGELDGGVDSDQPTPVPSETPAPTPIDSPSPLPSPTVSPTSTPISSPTPTTTPSPTPTSTPTSSPTPTVTPTPTSTPTPVPTATPTPTPSGTPTPNPTYAGVVINASRLTGTAPASFYFDVVDQLSWPAIEEARFDWDFGDGSPMFRGYMAAHVYDQPGTYQVTLRVYYQGAFVREARRTVQVTPFSGTTCYVSSSTGANTNSGLSPSAPFATYQYAMQQCFQSNRRILFRRGDTFTIAGGVYASGIENFILGAYGTGAAPHFNWPHTGLWDSAISGSFTNSSFQDFSITGNFVPNVSAGASVFQIFGQHNTVQRITASNLWRFVYTNASTDALVFKDLDLRTLDAYGHYGSNSKRLAFLDSAMEYSHYEHLIRIQGGHKVLVNNVHFNLVRTGKNTLTFRGDFTYGLVSDSRFDRATTVGPENNESYQLQDFVIYERNDIFEGEGSLQISAEHIVVRNNLFSKGGHISLRTHPLVGPANFVRIYNNTFYAPGQYHTSVLLHGASNVTMVNNIMSGLTSIFESHAYSIGSQFNPSLAQIDFNSVYQPNRSTASSFFLYYPNSIMSLSTWRNTYGKEVFIQTGNPEFLDPANGNFALSTTSTSRNSGVPMELLPGAFEDYFGTLRSLTVTNRGAVQ